MEASDIKIQEVVADLINELPVEAEDDYRAWLANPSEEGLRKMLEKYGIDAGKIARAKIIKEKSNE